MRQKFQFINQFDFAFFVKIEHILPAGLSVYLASGCLVSLPQPGTSFHIYFVNHGN